MLAVLIWEAEVHKIILAGALAGVTFFEVVGSEVVGASGERGWREQPDVHCLAAMLNPLA